MTNRNFGPRGSLEVVDGRAPIWAVPLTDLIKEDEDQAMIVDLGPIEGRIEERMEFLGVRPSNIHFHFLKEVAQLKPTFSRP